MCNQSNHQQATTNVFSTQTCCTWWTSINNKPLSRNSWAFMNNLGFIFSQSTSFSWLKNTCHHHIYFFFSFSHCCLGWMSLKLMQHTYSFTFCSYNLAIVLSQITLFVLIPSSCFPFLPIFVIIFVPPVQSCLTLFLGFLKYFLISFDSLFLHDYPH